MRAMPCWKGMAVLLSGSALSKSFGARVLFENLSVSLSDGDRTGVIGPNGSGKTTLLEILAGKETPDAGTRALRKQTRLAYVPQDSLFGPDDTVGIIVAMGLVGLGPSPEPFARLSIREIYIEVSSYWPPSRLAAVKGTLETTRTPRGSRRSGWE